MCRLALLNKSGIDYIENSVGLKNLFNHLETSLGGHGNGYCIIFNNGKTRINKGIQLSNKEITDDILKNYKGIKWVIYHTRLASMGSITDANCHPFEDNNNIIAMNGTEPEIKKWIKNNTTDTETILKICNKLEVNIKEGTKKFNSVFLGYDSDSKKVFANRNNGNLELFTNNNAIIFSSEFLPELYKNNNIYLAPKTWEEGQKINIKNAKLISKISKKITKNYYNDYYVPVKYRLMSK